MEECQEPACVRAPSEEWTRNRSPVSWLCSVPELCRCKKVLLSWSCKNTLRPTRWVSSKSLMLRGPATELVEAFPDTGAFEPLDDVSEPVVDFIAAVPEFVIVAGLDFEALLVRESLEESRISPVFCSFSLGADAGILAEPELLRSGVGRTVLDAGVLADGIVGFWGVPGSRTRTAPGIEGLVRVAVSEETLRGELSLALELGRLTDGAELGGVDILGAALGPPPDVDRPTFALDAPCECPPLLPPPRLFLSPAKPQLGAAQSSARLAVKTVTPC